MNIVFHKLREPHVDSLIRTEAAARKNPQVRPPRTTVYDKFANENSSIYSDHASTTKVIKDSNYYSVIIVVT